jgi:hypothetical protein
MITMSNFGLPSNNDSYCVGVALGARHCNSSTEVDNKQQLIRIYIGELNAASP